MKVIDLRTQTEIVPENFERVFAMLAHEALTHGEVANTFDTQAAFNNNTFDLIIAQSMATANDSVFTLIKEDALENARDVVLRTDEPDVSFEARVDAKQEAFKSTKEIVKTITTKDGKVRGFTTNFDDPKVIKVNFKPNRHNTLGNTG